MVLLQLYYTHPLSIPFIHCRSQMSWSQSHLLWVRYGLHRSQVNNLSQNLHRYKQTIHSHAFGQVKVKRKPMQPSGERANIKQKCYSDAQHYTTISTLQKYTGSKCYFLFPFVNFTTHYHYSEMATKT